MQSIITGLATRVNQMEGEMITAIESKAKFENSVYPKLRAYIKENGGFSSDKLSQTPLYQEYLESLEQIKAFASKKVVIKFGSKDDWFSSGGEKTGKIVVDNEGRIKFFEGRKTAYFSWLDTGLYEGWRATLIVFEINVA